MAPRGAHGIAIAPPGLDPAATASLDRVIDGQDDGPIARNEGDDQAQEDLTGGEAGPGITVQDAVIIGEVPLPAEPHDAQDGADGARSGGQDGPDGEGLSLGPDAVGEEWCKGGQDGYHLGW